MHGSFRKTLYGSFRTLTDMSSVNTRNKVPARIAARTLFRKSTEFFWECSSTTKNTRQLDREFIPKTEPLASRLSGHLAVSLSVSDLIVNSRYFVIAIGDNKERFEMSRLEQKWLISIFVVFEFLYHSYKF